ncbi:MAG: phosphopantetheine-binding protein [Planctomycetota bacterium]
MSPDPAAPSRPTLDRIKGILRRDLKLGDTFEIADDMPLVGSDLDLDSLDFLMVVTSVEKELGYKIPNEDIGETIFTSVDTLARYLEPRVGA